MLIGNLAAIAAVLLVAGAATVQETPPDGAAVKEKKVCRLVTATGSVMGKRICLTKSDWAKFNHEYEKQNRAFRHNQERGGINPTR
jgi:hypothetical protein